MMAREGLVMAALLGLGCGGGVDFDQARVRFAEGKSEEGLAALERGCLEKPGEAACAELSQRRAEVDVRAAQAAIDKGEFLAAEGRLIAALATSHEPTRQAAEALRTGPALQEGLAQERALLYADQARERPAIEKLAAGPTPLGARASAMAIKERPAWLVREVELACDPARLPRRSCTDAWAALKAAGLTGPEADRARAVALREEQRVMPLRKQAESFLPVFGAQGKRDTRFTDCMKKANDEGEAPDNARARCTDESYGTRPGYEGISELFSKEQNNHLLFEKILAGIDDPSLVSLLESRRQHAIEAGVGVAEPVVAAVAEGGKK
jgi:hypothetical protein